MEGEVLLVALMAELLLKGNSSVARLFIVVLGSVMEEDCDGQRIGHYKVPISVFHPLYLALYSVPRLPGRELLDKVIEVEVYNARR